MLLLDFHRLSRDLRRQSRILGRSLHFDLLIRTIHGGILFLFLVLLLSSFVQATLVRLHGQRVLQGRVDAESGAIAAAQRFTITMYCLLEGTKGMTGVALALYLWQEVLFAFEKVWMFENLLVASFDFGLVKVVHVELADEGGKVVVLEVLWQDLITERLRLLYHEAITFFCPSDNVLSQRIVHDLKQFDQEGGHMIYGLVLLFKLKVLALQVSRAHACLTGPFGRR